MPLFDHFSFLAPWYDRIAKPPDMRNWRSLLQLPCDGLLLDVGGGTGRLSHPLRGDTGGVVLADVADGMLSEARKKAGLQVVMSEGETLPFPDGCFARIMMVDALHHVRDHAAVAHELARVLQPGGRLIVLEPDITDGFIRAVAVAEKLLLMRSHFLRAEAMAALFDGQGVKVHVQRQERSVWLVIEKPAQ